MDTLYIAFKGKKSEKKQNIQSRTASNDFTEKAFQFKLECKKNTLNFEYVKYKNLEKKNSDLNSEERSVNKAFLRQNRNKILRVSKLKSYSYEEIACEIFSQIKTIYIIDYTERKGITMYEVNSMNYCPSIE